MVIVPEKAPTAVGAASTVTLWTLLWPRLNGPAPAVTLSGGESALSSTSPLSVVLAVFLIVNESLWLLPTLMAPKLSVWVESESFPPAGMGVAVAVGVGVEVRVGV